MTLRVAIDARELEGHVTGVGRVVEGLIESWPQPDEIVLISRGPVRVPSSTAQLTVDEAPGPRRIPGSAWEQAWLPGRVRRARAQVLVSPAYGMPWASPVPTAVCMHDCAFAAIPETFRPRERWRRSLVARLAARRAAFLFMGSHFAAEEARRHLGVPPERTVVLPWGVSRRFRRPDDAAVQAMRERFGIQGPTVLFVGARLQRRQLPMLADVVDRLARRVAGLQLLIIGERPAAERGDGLVPGRARWLGWVDEAELPALYAAADVVAYPSTYEGFGLPVLEALACDTPVVTADCTALAEVFPGRAVLVPPASAESWERELGALLVDPEQRDAVTRVAGPWARARDWNEAAVELRRRLAAAAGVRP